jgi:hypothetical protein
LFPALGHSTAFSKDTTPVDIAIQWIKQKAAEQVYEATKRKKR